MELCKFSKTKRTGDYHLFRNVTVKKFDYFCESLQNAILSQSTQSALIFRYLA